MAKKNPGGNEDRKRRGMKTLVIPVTDEQHTLIRQAAALAAQPGPVTRWAAAALEESARADIAAALPGLASVDSQK